MECFQTGFLEIPLEPAVERETPGQRVLRVQGVYPHLRAMVPPVQVAGPEEMRMGEGDDIHRARAGVEHARTVDEEHTLAGVHPVGRMLQA